MMYIIASISGFIAVALGAFGAHALREMVSARQLEVFQTGVSYQFYHVLALFVAAYFWHKSGQGGFKWAFRLFALGTLLFSGSLYAYVLSGYKFFAIITPVGGISFLAGWALLTLAFYKSRDHGA